MTTITNQFQTIQAKLGDRWQSLDSFQGEGYDIVVIPSISVDQQELLKVEGFFHYEERLLFYLMCLRNPRTRLIYVTSIPIPPILIDYYLHLLPGIPFSHARDRVFLFSTYDYSLKPLSQKLLERPRLLERIRAVVSAEKAFITCYNSTSLERDLSIALNIPLFALDPELLYWGTKSGSREIFAESEVPHPDGSQLVYTVDELAEVTAQLWERKPDLTRIVIKLNEGFSGEGNAIFELNKIANFAPNEWEHQERVKVIKEEFAKMRFQAKNETWSNFQKSIPKLGAIAEAFIEGKIKRSPSFQGVITPAGKVKILSTHDQILGGEDQQIYLGCTFPADESYRLKLQELGLKVGEKLAEKGALERFGVDFVTVYDSNTNTWDIQAIEINLRKGGTTHPFMTLKLITNGTYNPEDGLFYSQKSTPKYYIATDNLKKPQYRGLLTNDLIDIIADHRLYFDSSTETGTVFHLMGSLSEFGKLGVTSIGNSLSQAEEKYQHLISVLDQETSANH
jgi:PGM1 C-terminal domain/ATP-grasp domain